ncbi:uncharacterized protein F5147DRAFT_652369 [Suillus discolor]|uniref:Uncharacterized protein n=1 Tax=Suillus discolor TaxID=1912936 RepID=A0A9P7JUM7_9AGAM|nr:uncharacterized protein F5147DRAFT_652369 [Suillus discolor]KAG2109269.1 hypothetical protein F5147DRAFT_652369 [Suillus discolor]
MTMHKTSLMYPKAGIQEVISLLFHERDISVPRSVVSLYFAVYEPELIRERKARSLKRRRFWAAGVNDLFAVDQHDKWLRFGLGLHTGIELFSGCIMWIHVWHSNRNPQLILSYYLDTIEELGRSSFISYMPLITQSDPGTENFGIANAQTLLRFEMLLDHGVNEDWYDIGNTLQNMVFRWVFIPWLQQELDAYRDRINNTAKRRDRNKADFKVIIDRDGVNRVRELYIKPSHPVFNIVPPTLGNFIQDCYGRMGSPEVTCSTVWMVYRNLLSALQLADNVPPSLLPNEADEDSALPLLEGCSDLPFWEEPNGPYYMGGVGSGLGLGMEYYFCSIWLLIDVREDTSHHSELDALADADEPNVPLLHGPIEQSDFDHTGLVIWDFSDNESIEAADEW